MGQKMADRFAVDNAVVMTIAPAIIEALYQAYRKHELPEYDLMNNFVRTERKQKAAFRTISILAYKITTAGKFSKTSLQILD
jgi:hypothetical protein